MRIWLRSVVFFVIAFKAQTVWADDGVLSITIAKASVDSAGQLHLMVKNNSTLSATAFSMRDSGGQVLIQEFLPPKQIGLLPAQAYDFVVESNSSLTETDSTAYKITAAILVDGTAIGAGQDINRIRSLQAGRAYRLRQIIPLLKGLKDDRDGTVLQKIPGLLDEVSGAPLFLDDGTPAKGLFASGMQSANTLTTSSLRRIEITGKLPATTSAAVVQQVKALIKDHKIALDSLEKIAMQ